MATRALAAMLSFIGFAAVATATDHPQIARKLVLKDAGGRRSLRWVTKMPIVQLPTVSPLTAGARLRIAAGSADGVFFELPASGWSANGAGTIYKFKNKLAPGGPSAVKVAVLKDAKVLKVAAKSSGLTLDEPSQGAVSIELRIGMDVYCSECTTPVEDTTGRYKAKLCPAPTACPAAFCGNDVVDQPSEQCDGTDPGICASVPLPFTIGCDAPTSAEPCTCCSRDDCFIDLSGPFPCCDGAQCQDVSGAGMVRSGVCIPPACSADADCHGYRCVGGTCCGDPGQLCGVAGCCADSGATCEAVPSVGTSICCKPSGAACTTFIECCTLSCTAGACD
jgi:hypothetical protein